MKSHLHAAIVLALAFTCAEAASTSDPASPACTKAVVETALALNPDLNRLAIDISVRGDVAVLEGVVRSDIQRELAERVALAAPGVLTVENKLVTRRDTARNVDLPPIARVILDATIVARVKSQLRWSASTRRAGIGIESNYGRVTLRGTVPSEAARAWAERVAASTRDVTSVISALEVSPSDDEPSEDPHITDSEITTMVSHMLHFNRHVDDTHMEVSTVNGTVSLYGRVPSETQRDLAAELARSVVGVEGLTLKLEV